MSEATIPEVQVQPPTFGGAPGAPVIQVNGIADMLARAKNRPADAPKIEVETPKETEKTPEPTQVTKEPEKAPEQAKEPPKGSKEESLANLRKAKEAADKEIQEWKQKHEALTREYETVKTKPFELPEDVKTRLETAEKEREAYSKELSAAKLERHPEFIAKYQKGIESSVQLMQQIALEAGVDKDSVMAGMGRWDQNAFGEWHEQMNPAQKAKFAAAWVKSEELYTERNQKLQEAETQWQELSKTQEQQAKAQFEESINHHTKLAKGLLKELILDNETLMKDHEDLASVAEAAAMRAAKFEMPAEEVFRAVIHNQALARISKKQMAAIEDFTKQIEEKDKKIAELEAFVADRAGATPRPNAVGVTPSGSQGKEVPIWQRIKIGA